MMYTMGYRESNICMHGTQNTPDNCMHAIWDCIPVKHFWNKITKKTS